MARAGTELLLPVVQALAPQLAETTVLTADAGYHSEANLQQLHAMHVDALIADNDLRRRDERFATQNRYLALPHPLHNKTAPVATSPVFAPSDFTYDADARTCVCPAGKSLYRKGRSLITKGFVGEHFRGTKRDCGPCALPPQCLRTPDTTPVRNVAFFRGREEADHVNHTARMKARIDTPEGRAQYSQRFATVEPVFANLRHNKRLDRFTLRGSTKVNAQWQLYCLVHNIEKLAHAGYAA